MSLYLKLAVAYAYIVFSDGTRRKILKRRISLLAWHLPVITFSDLKQCDKIVLDLRRPLVTIHKVDTLSQEFEELMQKATEGVPPKRTLETETQ